MRICFELGRSVALAGLVLGAATGTEPPRRITSVVRADLHTGKLVRSITVSSHTVVEKPVTQQVVAPRVVAPLNPEPAAPERPEEPPANVNEAVERIAAQHFLPPLLLHAVIRVESNYNPLAVSSKGAQGIMQLIPSTARRFGVSNSFNPVENIQGGARYLRYLLDLYGNYPLALAAYNAGEAAVARYGGVPPYRETQNYLLLIRKRLEEAKSAKQREKERQPVAPKPPAGPSHIREVVETDGTVRYVSR